MTIRDRELLELWEAAQHAHPLARPVLLLEATGHASPERLPLGVRDRQLLRLRDEWFGSAFDALVDCPHCNAPVELTFDGSSLADGTPERTTFVCTIDGHEVEARLPDTTDLLAVADSADEDEARRRLAARCLVHGAETLDDEGVHALAKAMEEADPAGDRSVTIRCPDCGQEWEAIFEPGNFLWREVDAAAIRLLRDVDALAAAYGWSEEAILGLSPTRRSIYLGMVTG